MAQFRPSILVVSCALVVGAAFVPRAAVAQDTVDLQVVGNASVSGTIRPASERERFLLELGAGTKVSAVAKAKSKKGAFVPRMDLTDPSDVVLANGVVKGRGSKLVSPAVVNGGTHALRVFGDGSADGDYSVAITLKPQKSFAGKGTSVPAELQLQYTFGAPAGTKARIVLKPGAGKTFVPSLDGLDGPGEEHFDLTGTSTQPLLLARTGDWTVSFHDGGGVGGEWVCQVILTLPKIRRAKIDISAAALTGNFADQQPVYGRLVDDGGALIDPPDTGGSLDGASVSIPSGGMPFPVVITMSPAPPIVGLGGNHPAGPAIQFGPPGTQFNPGKSATINLPYDASRFTDPQSELTVYVMDELTGAVTPIAKPYDFSTPGVVSFAAPHFSIYMAASAAPRPVAGRWIVGSLEGEPSANFGTNVGATVGALDFTDAESGNFFINLGGRNSTWTAFDAMANGPSARNDYAYDYDSGTYSESGSTVYLTPQFGGGTDILVRATGGDVMLRSPDSPSNSTFAIALRESEGEPTLTNIAGRWTMLAFSRAAENRGGGQPADIQLATELAIGTAVFREDGSVSIAVPTTARAESSFPNGSWRVNRKGFSASGVVQVYDGIMAVRFEGEGQGGPASQGNLGPQALGPEMRLRPCLDGEVLLAARDSGIDEPMLFVFVREGRGLNASALDGASGFVFGSNDFVDAADATESQRLSFLAGTGTATYDGAGHLTTEFNSGQSIGHDATGQPVASPTPSMSDSGTYALTAAGAYHDSQGFRGAMVKSGRLLIGGATVGSRQTIFAVIPGADLFNFRKR